MITVILGKSGFGKTYFTKEIVSKLTHCFVVDTKGEYDLFVLRDYGEFVNSFSSEQAKKFSLRFSEWEDYFSTFEFLRRNCKNFNLIIDELGLFVDSRSGNKSLNDLTLIHKDKCNLFFITQSARFISTIMLTQANMILCFHLKRAEIENLNSKIALDDNEQEKIIDLKIGEKIKVE